MELKEMYQYFIETAEADGRSEVADHYRKKLLNIQTEREARIVGWLLLGIFVMTLIAPFISWFLFYR